MLGSGDINELEVRTEYLQRIEDSDTELAARVEQVRNQVRHELKLVAALKARVDAYNERLAAARSEIAAVRSRAEDAAARLDSLSADRSASLAKLKSRIGEWVGEIEAAEAASRAAAEETVGRWLGGPYSIPTYIVMCESGGNYGARQPQQRRRRRLPDPALDLGPLRRPGRPAGRAEGRTGPHRRRNLGRLRRQRLGLRRLNRASRRQKSCETFYIRRTTRARRLVSLASWRQ